MIIAQDMMIINVTPEQVVSRMTMPNMLSWPAPAPELEKKPVIGELSDQTRPEWITETRIYGEDKISMIYIILIILGSHCYQKFKILK